MASTSRPVAPSYKSRTLPRFPPLGAYERPLEEGAHVLGVLLGPAAARTGRAARREPTNARRCNGAMPDLNDTFGSLCLIALLAPVKAGGVKSDAIRAGKCPSQLAFPVLARSCTERRACLPLLRAGLTAAPSGSKKPKNRKTNQLDFFYGFKSGQWAYGHSVREAKKRPLTASQTEERRLSDRPVSRRDAAFSAWYRPEIAPSALLRKKKVGARGNRGRLSPARAPRGSHASPKMAEDNSARLQAMQDAVTDAGNDVRALKVCHAPGSFLYRLRHADRASISRNVASPTDPPGPRFRSPD